MPAKEKFYEYIGKKQRKKIEIPEIGETIYFTPVTIAEMELIRVKSQINISGQVIPRIDNAAFTIWSIITKAENETGEKIFGDADKPFLDQLDFNIAARIVNAIHGTEPIEDIVKKFKEGGDPFSVTSSVSPTEKSALSES